MKTKTILYCAMWILCCCSCSWHPHTASYQNMYSHLRETRSWQNEMDESSDYFIIFLVDARHLDYTNIDSLLRTIAKHPDDGSKNGDVGHAWFYMQGIINDKCVFIEGGHSGELGMIQPRYCDGVMNYIDYGEAAPSIDQRRHPRYEPNPIKYLWACQRDGFFQEGPGHHKPTFAAKISLTEEEFHRILVFINPNNYCYSNYAITRNQCSSFIAQIGAIIDFPFDYEQTIAIQQTVTLRGRKMVLWQDPQYSSMTFSSPDVIERSLMQAVGEERADYALNWYLKHRFLKPIEAKGYRRLHP